MRDLRIPTPKDCSLPGLVWVCRVARAWRFVGGQPTPETVDVDGTARQYVLAVPKTYSADRTYPLIVALHGEGAHHTISADLPVVGETCVGYGADGQASAGGKLGLDFGLHINAGAVNLALPETIGLQYSNAIRTLSSASITMPSNSFALTAGGLSYNSVHGPVSIAWPAR